MRERVCCRLNGERSVVEILILVTVCVELPRDGVPSASIPTARRLSAPIGVAALNRVRGCWRRSPFHAVLGRRQWSSSTQGTGSNWVLAAAARASYWVSNECERHRLATTPCGVARRGRLLLIIDGPAQRGLGMACDSAAH